MNYTKITLLSLMAFTLLGCEPIILEEDEDNETTISVHNGSIPITKSPVGSYVDLSEYLYPKELTIDKTLYFQKVYNYAQTSSNTFTNAPDISHRSYTKVINGDVTIVTEYKNTQEQTYDKIEQYKILSYKKNNEFIAEYPTRVAKNSVVSDTTKDKIQEVCVVVDIGEINLSTTKYLPLFVRNDLLNNQLTTENGEFIPEQFNFADSLHIYCGTGDNHTTDTYYSKQYGRVLKLQKDIDKNLLKVEVTDILSIENK